tara:strand:- start:1591 stop:2355 length:765 start_codon:yes stop_codon:yes gene_type:complete
MKSKAELLHALPKVIGHRGAAGHAPENTLASTRKAAGLGVRFVEVDATLTCDDEIVILHDSDLGRTTSGHGPVLLHRLEELRKLDAGAWFSKAYREEKIPTLRELTSLLKELGVGLNLEIKPTIGWQIPTAEKIAAELADYWPDELPLLVSSFIPETLPVIAQRLPHLPLGYLTAAIPPDWQTRMRGYGASSLHCAWPFVTEALVQDVQAEGYKLLAYTVNDTEVATRLYGWGVDGLFSDYPDRLLALFPEQVS